MTLQDIGGNIDLPPAFGDTVPTLTDLTIDADGELVAWVFQVQSDNPIAKVGFATGTVTTGDTLAVRLETVDPANGQPTGTLYAGSTAGTVVIADGDDDVFKWAALGSPTTFEAKEEFVAFVIKRDDGIGSGTANLQIAASINNNINTGGFPYTISFIGGAWTKAVNVGPCFAVQYNDGTIEYIPGAFSSVDGFQFETFNSGSTPNHRGNKFNVAVKCRAIGASAQVFRFLGGDIKIELWETDVSSANKLATTVNLDNDINGGSAIGAFRYLFDTGVTLIPGNDYYLLYVPQDTTNDRYYYFNVDNDGANKAITAHPLGLGCISVTSNGAPTNDASWTTDDEKKYMLALSIDQFDDGAGAGGGLLTHPGMQGGARG